MGFQKAKLTNEVDDTAGVTPLVVIPGDELDEVRVEGNSSLGIENGRVSVSVEIGGNNILLSVSQDT